ncbi:hypothetical protein EI94DRAFT_937266 [Lactarius quietus]|nr:hypothetical protein EI94DRAFT_937266 [Lactarius quietus]
MRLWAASDIGSITSKFFCNVYSFFFDLQLIGQRIWGWCPHPCSCQQCPFPSYRDTLLLMGTSDTDTCALRREHIPTSLPPFGEHKRNVGGVNQRSRSRSHSACSTRIALSAHRILILHISRDRKKIQTSCDLRACRQRGSFRQLFRPFSVIFFLLELSSFVTTSSSLH